MGEALRNGPESACLQQYCTLLGVAEAITSHRDLQALFHDLAGRLHQVVRFDYLACVLHDATNNSMFPHVLETTEPLPRPLPRPPSVEEDPAGSVLQTQRPMIVSNVADESRWPDFLERVKSFGVTSICYLPLTTARRRLGVLVFACKLAAAYDTADVDFLQRVANQVAVAVENALNYEAAQAAQAQLALERDRVRLLLEVNNAVVSHLHLDDLFPAVSACLRKVIQHDGSGLVLFDQETRRYRVHVLRFAKNESFIEEGRAESDCCMKSPSGVAITTRKPAVFGEQDLKNLCSESPVAQQLLTEGVKVFCSVPLLSHDRTLGALNVGRRREDAFSPADVELLGEVAKQIAIAVENAQAYREITELKDKLAEEKIYLEEEIRTEHNFDEIVGESAALRRVLKEVETVAPTDSTVLIRGDTGTGKELIARALHQLSPRRDRTFVKVNCAAIPTGLLESEMFGHEKGAFTGAITQKIGRFELAHLGTLFLDEVGDIPTDLQPKLLRVLQEQEFERLGSTRTVRVNVRVVAATNRDLGQMAGNGQFRSDLYYRLNVFPVLLPSLRDRREDIPRLVRHFAQKVARRMGRQIETIPAEALEALAQYPWPGNIRELENVIERAVILSPGPTLHINLAELKANGQKSEVGGQRSEVAVQNPEANNGPLSSLADAERQHILGVLRETGWVLGGPNGAAERLAMKRTTLQSKMKKLGIVRPG